MIDDAVQVPHACRWRSEPLPTKPDCWPLSLPRDVDAVDDDAGHGLEHRPGIASTAASAPSSSGVRVVAVPTRLVSTTGVLGRDRDLLAPWRPSSRTRGSRSGRWSRRPPGSPWRSPVMADREPAGPGSRFRTRKSPLGARTGSYGRPWWRRRSVTWRPEAPAPDASRDGAVDVAGRGLCPQHRDRTHRRGHDQPDDSFHRPYPPTRSEAGRPCSA